jgi:hypothetical protein
LLPFDLPRLFRLNGITFDLLAFYTQIVKLLLYISARIFRRYAMLALESFLGIIFPDGGIIRFVTRGTVVCCDTIGVPDYADGNGSLTINSAERMIRVNYSR